MMEGFVLIKNPGLLNDFVINVKKINAIETHVEGISTLLTVQDLTDKPGTSTQIKSCEPIKDFLERLKKAGCNVQADDMRNESD